MENSLKTCIKKLEEFNLSERAKKLKEYTETLAHKAVVHNWFKMLDLRLKLINFSDEWTEKYKPLKNDITTFSQKDTENKWLTQFRYGCLLFSLLNGNFVEMKWKNFFDFNLDFSHPYGKGFSEKQKVIGVVHEYKAILLLYYLTGNNVLGANLSNMGNKIQQMLNSESKEEVCRLANELCSILLNYEMRFAVWIKYGKKWDFADGCWRIFKKKAKVLDETSSEKLNSIKLRYLERLYKYSLFCLRDHWVTFLGCDGDDMIFYDSGVFDVLQRLPKSKVTKITTAVFIKGAENMEKDFSEIDFSNMSDDTDLCVSKGFEEIPFSTISDADWERLAEYQKNPPEFVRSMQATVNMDNSSSYDAEKNYEHVVNFYDRIEHEDIIFLLEYCGHFSESKMVAGFTLEEWKVWKEKEKDRIAKLKIEVDKKNGMLPSK